MIDIRVFRIGIILKHILPEVMCGGTDSQNDERDKKYGTES